MHGRRVSHSADVNADWHRQHKLGKHASLDDRVRWHLAHLEACDCRRDLPASVVTELRRREQESGR